MFDKIDLLLFTIVGYIGMRINNKETKYKIKIPHRIIKIVFPLLNKQHGDRVDLVSFLEAAYLIIACIVYYIVIIFKIASVDLAKQIWVGMLIRTTLIGLGWVFIRDSSNTNIVFFILLRIFGIGIILCGIIITIFYLAEIISGIFN